MRKNSGDMEIALEVPQPRLRAVPATETVSPPLDASVPSDADLLARVGERDREAFEILYGRYVRPVFSLALRKLHDRGHAEDAVQERGCQGPRPPARNRQDPHTQRPREARRRAGRRVALTHEPNFDELIGTEATGAERERLHHAHDLLVQAGPPPELPPSLQKAP